MGFIGGTVWLDGDHDGNMDSYERRLNDITVTWDYIDSSGNAVTIESTTTDLNGSYLFEVIPPNTTTPYEIVVTIPSGYEATVEGPGLPATDSEIDANGVSPVFTLDPSTDSQTVNAGLVNTAAPVANDDYYSVPPNQTLSVSSANGVLANDTDPSNLPLTASLVSGPSDGTLNLNSDGSFTYTPKTGYVGYDSFVYAANDEHYSSDATVWLTVAYNSPPTTVAQQYTVSHNAELDISGPGVLEGASDPNGFPLAAVLDSDAQYGYLTLNGDGSFEYAPNWNYVGEDSFTFRATDGLADSTSTTVTIQITNVAPVLTSPLPAFTVPENGSLSEDQPVLLSGAYDADGDSMMTGLVSGPADGEFGLNQDGIFIYEPDTGFVGTDSFTYEITDGLAVSSPITATIQVQAGSPYQLDGRDAGAGSTWMSNTEAASAGIYVSADDPNPAALLAHATGNANYQRIITWDPTQLSITTPGGSGGSSGSLTLNESDGDVQLTVVPVSTFAPGAAATISMAVQDTQTGQQVAFLNVNAVEAKAQLKQLAFTSDQGVMHNGNLVTNGDLLKGIYVPALIAGKSLENDPISQQADKPITVTLTLTGMGVAGGTAYTLTGTSQDAPVLAFSGSGNLTAAGKNVTASAATKALDGSIQEIQGSITWTLVLNPNTAQAQTINLGVTGKHRIYTTLGTPNQTATGVIVDKTVHPDPREGIPMVSLLNKTGQQVNPAAVTEARMDETVKAVAAAIAALKANGVNAPQPSQIIWQVLRSLGNFNLKGDKRLTGVGAWNVPGAAAAQCISMAEFTSLVAWMSGAPGTVTPVTYYALKANPSKALPGTLDKDKAGIFQVNIGGRAVDVYLSLVDNNGGHNAFEAP